MKKLILGGILLLLASACAWTTVIPSIDAHGAKLTLSQSTQNILHSISTSFSSLRVATAQSKNKDVVLQELYEENVWKNDLFLWILPSDIRENIPHIVQVWPHPPNNIEIQLQADLFIIPYYRVGCAVSLQ